MTRINLVNMHKEIGTAPDSFLNQQTSGIMMRKGDGDGGVGGEGREGGGREKKLFLTSPHPPSQHFTLSLGHHCPKPRQLTGVSFYFLPTLITQ